MTNDKLISMRPLQPAAWLASLWSRSASSRAYVSPRRALMSSSEYCRPAVVTMVVVTSLLLLGAVCVLPFSIIYSKVHDKNTLNRYLTEVNNQRTDEALMYLQNLPHKTDEELQAMSKLPQRLKGDQGQTTKNNDKVAEDIFTFTVAIVTVGRKNPTGSNRTVGYVLQSATAIDAMIRGNEIFTNKTFLFICNVDAYPANHNEAGLIRDRFPYVERYGGSSIPGLRDLAFPGANTLYRDMKHTYIEDLGGSLDRERHDYTFCLQAAQKIPSKYYLVFQDDTLPRPEFVSVLELTLNKVAKCENEEKDDREKEDGLSVSLLTKSSSSSSSSKCLSEHPPYTIDLERQKLKRTIFPSPDSKFGYIKFYFPDRWLGFSLELEIILDLISMASVGGGVALVIHFVACFARKASFVPTWKVFLLGIILVFLICQLLGRQNMNELRRASKYFYRLQPAPDCCIPAMLYPAPVVPFLVSWLAESPPRSAVDLRISACFKHYQMPTYYVEPNTVRHVGKVTSLLKVDKKPLEEFLII